MTAARSEPCPSSTRAADAVLARSTSPAARLASTSTASSAAVCSASPAAPLSPRSRSEAATRGWPCARRRWASARSASGCSSRPTRSCSASPSLPCRTRSSASVATVGAASSGRWRACTSSAVRRAASASSQRPLARSTSAWIVRHEPYSGAVPLSRANASTCSHHSAARSQSPALVQAAMRLQYASASVWTFRTRPAEAAAIASSRSRTPSSQRPALTSVRPRTLNANTSRSSAPVSRAIVIARRAWAARSSSVSACRACSTATHPLPGHVPASATARSARASQPRAADSAAADVVLVRDPDGEAGGVVAAPVARVALDGALASGDASLHVGEEPEREPEPVERVGRLFLGERVLERLARILPARRLERGESLGERSARACSVHRRPILGRGPPGATDAAAACPKAAEATSPCEPAPRRTRPMFAARPDPGSSRRGPRLPAASPLRSRTG